MAHDSQLPCDGDGICMLCKNKPPDEEKLTCNTCVTPWHVSCLAVKPETLSGTLQWGCPDCTTLVGADAGKSAVAGGDDASGGLIAAIRAIEADASLTEREKAKKRQRLLSGGAESAGEDDGDGGEKSKRKGKEKVEDTNHFFDLLDETFKCSFCIQLPERPVTTPCGHNFCLKCFQKWVGQGKHTCIKCRSSIPAKMASQPRINSTLVAAIRMAKMSKSNATGGLQKVYHFVHNQNRPDKAYTTERAVKAGKANAASGRIFVTVAPDHFGPILAENDPERNQGVLVGECWEGRLECRQWGIHLPPVSGICGQSNHGAQSVVLSGGYEDDEDHGEWFLYTGSGGRDLSGNKRTNKEQSFDQTFDKSNEALRVSCRKGYPVRVVRSHKEKRSSYAPEEKVLRYDGIYRIDKCWRKVGKQGFKVCRYLFVRCDNDPAPWTSDVYGDRPRPLPVIPELKQATDVTERKESPSWDYDEEKECWKWKKPPPPSKKPVTTGNAEGEKSTRKAIRKVHMISVKEKLLKGFSCLLCQNVMTLPLTTPCAHNFCKPCLEGVFAGQSFVKERTTAGGRTLRSQKNVMKCPTCHTDISEFLQNPKVNREIMGVIEKLQCRDEEDDDTMEECNKEEGAAKEESSNALNGSEEHDLPTPQAECSPEKASKRKNVDADPPIGEKPKRTNKRKKTDAGGGSSKIDDNGMKTGEKSNEEDDSRVHVLKRCAAEGASNNQKTDGGAEAENKMAQDAAGEGIDSPSSPLNVGSEDDDSR
ncbi:E3 ubiquitin-protein ligase ORTHRUS 2-like [Cornus florida]|uniref:E3 ubiquitin-protein ligase ORTHRUS 2-like n=1 Tax=Cornus florida TaxID=4283 RepID=UPI00289930E0|nr:E3 ubiquitin-protein ligase ORTHRUS 2-like [Cornus florida]